MSHLSYVNIQCLARTIASLNAVEYKLLSYDIQNVGIIDRWFAEMLYPSLDEDANTRYPMLDSAYNETMRIYNRDSGSYDRCHYSLQSLSSNLVDVWLEPSIFGNDDEIVTATDRFGRVRSVAIPKTRFYVCPLVCDTAKAYIEDFKVNFLENGAADRLLEALGVELPKLNNLISKK